VLAAASGAILEFDITNRSNLYALCHPSPYDFQRTKQGHILLRLSTLELLTRSALIGFVWC